MRPSSSPKFKWFIPRNDSISAECSYAMEEAPLGNDPKLAEGEVGSVNLVGKASNESSQAEHSFATIYDGEDSDSEECHNS